MYIHHIPTCSKSSSHPHTLGATHCRDNVVVIGVCHDPLRENDGGHLTMCEGGVTSSEVSIRWVCTICNGAGVPWLKKCTLHKYVAWISGVNIDIKMVSICAAYEGRQIIQSQN